MTFTRGAWPAEVRQDRAFTRVGGVQLRDGDFRHKPAIEPDFLLTELTAALQARRIQGRIQE